MKFCSIKGHQEYVFTGDRVKDELLAFAMRMSGPPVQPVTQIDSFNTLKTQNEIFFTYVGQRNGTLWTAYSSIAEIFQPHGFFYSTSREIADRHFQIDALPVVLVYKENNHYHFPCKLLKYIRSGHFFFILTISSPDSVERFPSG